MTIWTMQPHERLRWWHQFRNEISKKSLEEAVWDTNHLWSYSPFVNQYLHQDNISNWPDPWELMYDNYYCDLARALGIVYTLYFTSHKPEMSISIFLDRDTNETYNLSLVNEGKYVCNLIHDEVVNISQIPKSMEKVKTITTSQLKLENIR